MTYDIEAWHEFAVMVGGAAAALAGLLIVAMSINIDEILKFDNLPPRAAAALVTMLTPLVTAVLILIPDQSNRTLGIELLVLGAVILYLLLFHFGRYRRSAKQSFGLWLRGTGGPMFIVSAGTVLAGVGLVAGGIGGPIWLAPAVIAAFLGGTAQAWVLLIEIRR